MQMKGGQHDLRPFKNSRKSFKLTFVDLKQRHIQKLHSLFVANKCFQKHIAVNYFRKIRERFPKRAATLWSVLNSREQTAIVQSGVACFLCLSVVSEARPLACNAGKRGLQKNATVDTNHKVVGEWRFPTDKS